MCLCVAVLMSLSLFLSSGLFLLKCERKPEIIEKIKLLDIETQTAIVSHIQEVSKWTA